MTGPVWCPTCGRKTFIVKNLVLTKERGYFIYTFDCEVCHKSITLTKEDKR